MSINIISRTFYSQLRTYNLQLSSTYHPQSKLAYRLPAGRQGRQVLNPKFPIPSSMYPPLIKRLLVGTGIF
jgi:hypothetical protein